jgi:hypothetical protein
VRDDDHLEDPPDEAPRRHRAEALVPTTERLVAVERSFAEALRVKLARLACSTSCSTAAVVTAGHRQGA